MKFTSCGGIGEHGRNCFYVEGKSASFFVDCGTTNGKSPDFTPAQAASADYLFLTHSHADHIGAVSRLIQFGFRGLILASGYTLKQLPVPYPRTLALDREIPCKYTDIDKTLSVKWGRSGHCDGSIWLKLRLEKKHILFSGDYHEDSPFFRCNPIRHERADLAVLDCAYGKDETPDRERYRKIIVCLKANGYTKKTTLLPVPANGRGAELLSILPKALQGSVVCDEKILLGLQKTPWHKRKLPFTDSIIPLQAETWNPAAASVIFIGDAQCKKAESRTLAESVLERGGRILLTGHLDDDSYAKQLLDEKRADFLSFPIHGSQKTISFLQGKNSFERVIPYHTADFTEPKSVLF